MRTCLVVTGILAGRLFSFVEANALGQASAEPAAGEYVRFPAVGIKLQQPAGFEKSDSFEGFGQPESKSSVMALSIPGPFSKVSAGFTQEQMKARGWTLLSREEKKVGRSPGLLIHFEQPAGGSVFRKWSLVFGDEQKTTLVTATFPKTLAQKLSAPLKAVVLSTQLDGDGGADPAAAVSFTLVASKKLKLTPGITKTLAYTKDGVMPAKSPKDPLFVAVASVGEANVANKQFAERRIQQTAKTKRLVVKSNMAITVDGLDGYESLADAEDEESGTPLVVYQAILFDKGSYFLMQGLAGAERTAEYLPEFKAMARSFRRKQP